MQRIRQRLMSGIWTVAALCTSAGVALASGGADAHGGGHGAPHVEWFKWDMNAPPVGWLFINFALFVFILVRFGGGPLQNYLLQRHNAVRKAMEEAAAAKQEAERKAAEYEARIKRLDEELAAMKAEFRRDGERLRERLMESGKQAAQRILKDAALTIAAEEKRAEQLLQEETARLALQLAESMVREQLKPDDHARLNQDFIKDLRS